MDFVNNRRQQFLTEKNYVEQSSILVESIDYFANNALGAGSTRLERDMLARLTVAEHAMDLLILKYTAGESLDSLRNGFAGVVDAYEIYGRCLREFSDQGEPVFSFTSLDDYCSLVQLIGLSFLLHRRDILPRIAVLQDGVDEENGGTDTLYEEFMAHATGPDTRYVSDYLCCSLPYKSLFHALTETTPEARLEELHRYLKRWYKDLAGCAWHDAHKLNDDGEQNGYYGYWSFEAGAAVILLSIEDDSSLHKYLYYPKDLVAWCREHAAQYPDGGLPPPHRQHSVQGGLPCPKEGWWLTVAQTNSRRHFKVGEIFPKLEGNSWGTACWMWSTDQASPAGS